MYGMASEDTPPVTIAGTARSATPQIKSPAVDDRVSRDPASSTFHPAWRNAAPRAARRAAPRTQRARR